MSLEYVKSGCMYMWKILQNFMVKGIFFCNVRSLLHFAKGVKMFGSLDNVHVSCFTHKNFHGYFEKDVT